MAAPLGQRLAVWAMARSARFWSLSGLVLLLPTLAGGWVADDYLQLLAQRTEPGIAGLHYRPLDLFRFADGNVDTARAMMEQGIFPWWADPSVRLSFLRPLASATHALDACLWPNSSVAMHAHSLLWYAALLFGADRAFRRFSSSPRVAVLALSLLSLDDSHAPVVGWIANRNSVVAVAIMLAALLWHDVWRQGKKHAAWLSHGLFAAGLCAGEGAFALVPYWCGYALCVERGHPLVRLRSLLGYLFVLAAWRALGAHLGYGVSRSGLYVDPSDDLARFLSVAPLRALSLLLGLFAAPYSDFWEIYPLLSSLLQPLMTGFAVLVLSLLGWLAWPALRARPAAQLWLCGALGAVLPVCASFPHDRLLLGASIGSAGVLAEVAGEAGRLTHGVWLQRGVGFLLALHLVFAPVLRVVRASTVGGLDAVLLAEQATIPNSTAVRGETVVLLNPPLDPLAAYLAPYRELHHIPRPAALYWLATGVSELRVTSLDAHTLRVRPRDGYLSSSSQRMLREPTPSTRYEPVHLQRATFEVSETTGDGRPAELLVRFQQRLDDPRLRLLRWQRAGYVPFVPPMAGRSVTIPAVDCFGALLGPSRGN